MSILIKGMEMPTEGTVIAIYKLNGKFYASVHGTELCPLFPVPPHGRLVDADRILSEQMKRKYYHLPNGDTAIPVIDVEHAPTVIPAEPGEEYE